MNYKEYSFTASEITQLEYMLSIMPDDLKVERIGLEYRLKKARQRLEGVPIPPRPKSVHANFQGEPVVDMVGHGRQLRRQGHDGVRRINGNPPPPGLPDSYMIQTPSLTGASADSSSPE